MNVHEGSRAFSSKTPAPVTPPDRRTNPKEDYPSLHAETMGNYSGVYLDMIQLAVYRRLEGGGPDQVVYAKVLALTNGPVDAFMARYSHVVFPSELKNY